MSRSHGVVAARRPGSLQTYLGEDPQGVLAGRVVWRWGAVSRRLHLKGGAPAGLNEIRQQRATIADDGAAVREEEMLELKLLQ